MRLIVEIKKKHNANDRTLWAVLCKSWEPKIEDVNDHVCAERLRRWLPRR
jgi:hypothetical protein